MYRAIGLILLSFFVALAPMPTLATESVVCSNDEIGLFVSFGFDKHYSGFVLYTNNKMNESSDWQTKKLKTNFNKMTLFLKAKKISDNKTTLQLNAFHENGTILLGGKTYKVSCDWSALNEAELRQKNR